MPSDSEQRGRVSPPRRPTRKKSQKNTPETFSNMSQKERTYPSCPILNTNMHTITIDHVWVLWCPHSHGVRQLLKFTVRPQCDQDEPLEVKNDSSAFSPLRYRKSLTCAYISYV